MTAGRIARAVGFVLATVILAVSGIYVVVDLARWEWNRAVISALVMIAALIVVVAMMLFRQLHHIEQRMDALERARAAKEKAKRLLADVPEVNGVGLGMRGGEYVVKVNVTRPPTDAEAIPRDLDGVPVVVDVVGDIRPLQDFER